MTLTPPLNLPSPLPSSTMLEFPTRQGVGERETLVLTLPPKSFDFHCQDHFRSLYTVTLHFMASPSEGMWAPASSCFPRTQESQPAAFSLSMSLIF